MMKIDFKTVGVSPIIQDYLAQKEELQPHYHRFPTEENYEKQAQDKLSNFSTRAVLCEVIQQQMFGLALSPKQKENLNKLQQENTVTITTGHQLNLLTGPLYFVYKILHTIKICDELNQKENGINYVPLYWMATEDHDFLEINHFNTYKETYRYDAKDGGFVGNIPAKETQKTLDNFISSLPNNIFGKELKQIITDAYFEAKDLTEATRRLVHTLLGKYGILIIDGNDAALKRLMIPYFEQELLGNATQEKISETNKALHAYKHQAYAREINLFYDHQGYRERIEFLKGKYVLTSSKKAFTQDEILKELTQFPEKFSPNVILRPLYQEVILPNVAYVGGGGEIAYWLQLKEMFKHYRVSFPMLVVRNSMLILPQAILHKIEKLGLLPHKIFEPKFKIKREQVTANSPLFHQLEELKEDMAINFEKLENIAEKTGDDFAKMVKAQKVKHLNGYAKMKHRLQISEQKQQRALMHKIDEIYDFVYPKKMWQERFINFSYFYQYYGNQMFDDIYQAMEPFNSSYHILKLESILK